MSFRIARQLVIDMQPEIRLAVKICISGGRLGIVE